MGRKQNIANRREHVMQAANRLFCASSFDKTTMEDISRETGIPRATIYLEFPGGKEDIMMAIGKSFLEEALASMRELARQSQTTHLDTLRHVIIHYILWCYDRASQTHFTPANVERHSKRLRSELGEFFKRRTLFFSDLLKQAAMAGEISLTQDFERIAELLSHSLICWLPPIASQFSRDELELKANAFLSLMLSGLAKAPRKTALLVE